MSKASDKKKEDKLWREKSTKKPNVVSRWFEDVVKLYDEMYFTYRNKHNSNETNYINPKKGHLGVDFSAIHDKNNITYMYVVYKMPRKMVLDYKAVLRGECEGTTRLHFLHFNRPHTIDWESQQMKGRLAILKQVGDANNGKERDAYNYHKNAKKFGTQRLLEESLVYLAEAETEHHRALLKQTNLMVLTGKRGEDMDVSSRALEERAKKLGFVMERVMYDIADTLGYYSPFSRQMRHPAVEKLPTQVVTDEIAARHFTYEQGTIGTRGVYFGSDIDYKFPVLKVIKKRYDSAETIVVVAETGGGKSNLIKNILLQVLNSKKFIATLMDVEGFEYTPIRQFVGRLSKTIQINMGQDNGRYYDPVEIPPLTGDEKIDNDLYNISKDYSLSIFNIIAGKLIDTDDFVPNIIKKGISNFYKDIEVHYEDRETWVRTKGKRLHDIYASIKRYVEDEKKNNLLHEKHIAIEKLMLALADCFEPDGTMAHIFSDSVSIEEIIEAKVIQCSFGMAGKSEKTLDNTTMGLMQLFAAALSHVRSVFAKARGVYNVKVWEEFQRWGHFKDSHRTIGTAITGGRKLGDVNIIITNDVKVILDDDKFSILSNYSSFIAGAIADEEVRARLAQRISYPQMKTVLDEIAASAKKEDDLSQEQREKIIAGDSGESKYTYSFLTILDRNKVAVTKLVLNPDIVSSPLFRTGVDASSAFSAVD